jgi:RNA polymerase sigma-70 factor (ECF subfamily)
MLTVTTPTLTPEVQARLGLELRNLFAEMSAEPLPERFSELLRRLEETERQPGGVDEGLKKELIAFIPNLRAYGISLTRNADQADDLVQETLIKAWNNLHRFERGTNLGAWLFTILRNQHHSNYRKLKREVEDPDGAIVGRMVALPEQPGRIALNELREALTKLGPDQREALLLIGAQGLSYEEVAEICGVAVGTVKSRVNRARNTLAQLLAIENAEDLGPDRLTRAAALNEPPV